MEKRIRGLAGLLIKIFVKNHDSIKDVGVREQYGKLSSYVGIVVNIFLFAAKFIVGTMVGSVSIVGDAVNNLSDAGTSIISLISFKLSNKPADTDHPFGHARIEYIASSVVAVIILFIGFELLKTSIQKIINPVPVEFNIAALAILALSIIVKVWLYRFNRKMGKRIDSTMMQATAADSLSDVMATAAVLLSLVIGRLTRIELDGYIGVVVAGFILLSGIRILKETVNRILGRGPSKELKQQIENFIRKYRGVIGLHDLMVHDYGPQHCFASVHVEVDSNEDILASHELIDNIERDIAVDHGIHLVIHMDPIVTDDPYVNELHQMIQGVVAEVEESLSIHDFRVVKGSTHNNLIFDVDVPYECKINDKQILDGIVNKVAQFNKKLNAVVTIERSYVASPNRKAMK